MKKISKHDNLCVRNRSWDNPETHFYQAIESPWYKLIGRLNACIIESTVDFYRKKAYAPVMLPITCKSVSSPMGLGSDSLPVKIELHGQNVYLADSMQFYLEYILRQSGKGVYYIMPSFRGEEPDERHLNEFFHSEAEIVGDLNSVMNLVEDYLAAMTRTINTRLGREIEAITGNVTHLADIFEMDREIPRIHFSEAQLMLGKNTGYFKEVAPGIIDISRSGEKRLIEIFGGYVWLTHIPKLVTPFYQATDSTGKYSLAADLLMGIGETVGCGERHISAAQTLKALHEHHVDPDNYRWYLQLKNDYPLQTAGFGLGIERFLLWLLRHDDIRDIPAIPRMKGQSSRI